jgi:hypothetical protein
VAPGRPRHMLVLWPSPHKFADSGPGDPGVALFPLPGRKFAALCPTGEGSTGPRFVSNKMRFGTESLGTKALVSVKPLSFGSARIIVVPTKRPSLAQTWRVMGASPI